MIPVFIRGCFMVFALVGGMVSGNPVTAQGYYQEITVSSGGEIEGKVTLQGGTPPSRIFHLVFSPNIDYCQRVSDGKGNRILKEFEVDEDGGLKNAVVAVLGVEEGKSFRFTPKIEIENCRISPFVSPVRNFHPILLINRDPITHDIQAYSLKNALQPYTFQMFNKPLPSLTVASKRVKFRKGHYIFRTQCGVHDFMQSWGIAVGNPYFSVTDSKGHFSIRDIPPGTYEMIAWHPRLQIQAKGVTVPPNEKVSIGFYLDSSDVEIPIHDTQEGYRLETWLALRDLVPPSVELQVHQ